MAEVFVELCPKTSERGLTRCDTGGWNLIILKTANPENRGWYSPKHLNEYRI